MKLGLEGRVWDDDYQFIRETGHDFGSPYSPVLICRHCGKTKEALLAEGAPPCNKEKKP